MRIQLSKPIPPFERPQTGRPFKRSGDARPLPEIADTWGRWIDGLEDWKWYLTLTFRDPAPVPGASWTKPGWATANRAWAWTLAQWATPLYAPKWVRCFEMQKERGVPHIHALLSDTEAGRRFAPFAKAYWRKYGMSRIEPYDRTLGASFYLCKYVTKDLGDITFSPYLRGASLPPEH